MRSRSPLLALTLAVGLMTSGSAGFIAPDRMTTPPHYETEGDPDDLDRACPSASLPGPGAAVNAQPGDSAAAPVTQAALNLALQLLTLFGIAR